MKTVDEPESPAFSPDGRTVAFAGAARRGRRHLHDRSRDQGDRQRDERRLRGLRAELLARRQVPDLQRARQRQPEAVPPRPRHEEEDADHLRHRRRNRGAVHRRQHDRVLVDGHRSGRAARAGGREERQHLQHLDARPADRRAASVHRRPRRQLVGRRAERRTDQPHRLHQLLQGRVQHPHARAEGAAAHGGERRPRRAGPDHRLPGAAAAHARRGQPAQEEAVREDVSRGAAAGQRRRHEQRRHLRRLGNQLRRRDRRPAVQRLHRVDFAVPDDRRVVRQPVASRFQYALQGYSQTTFFYGQATAASTTIRRTRSSSTATTPRRLEPSAADRRSGSIRSTATAASSSREASSTSTSSTTIRAWSAARGRTTSSRPTGGRSSATAR